MIIVRGWIQLVANIQMAGSLEIIRDSHSWGRAVALSVAISLCIAVDILQYSFPLSFLPRSLEDEGHSARHVAAVIGGYYWSGFVGGVMLSAWQVWKILWERPAPLTLAQVRWQLAALVGGLLVGALTLLRQASAETYAVHMACRVAQGFLGAILFFYSYLLSIELFSGRQQLFALTLNTIALNVAEVGGPLLGATVFTVSGQASSFYALTALSFANQLMLAVAIWWLWAAEDRSTMQLTDAEAAVVFGSQRCGGRDGFERFLDIISNAHLWKAVVVIAPAALVKAEIENVLPLFADHSLGFDTIAIGLSFSAVALAFVASSVAIGLAWDGLSVRVRDLIVGASLVLLSVLSAVLLPLTELLSNSASAFTALLSVYGLFLGLTITPSSFLLGEFVDALPDAQSKDVANGLWNTIWELGGSLGFFVSGLANSEGAVISGSALTLVVAAVAFFFITRTIREDATAIKIL